jgi:hypothetical protein
MLIIRSRSSSSLTLPDCECIGKWVLQISGNECILDGGEQQVLSATKCDDDSNNNSSQSNSPARSCRRAHSRIPGPVVFLPVLDFVIDFGITEFFQSFVIDIHARPISRQGRSNGSHQAKWTSPGSCPGRPNQATQGPDPDRIIPPPCLVPDRPGPHPQSS